MRDYGYTDIARAEIARGKQKCRYCKWYFYPRNLGRHMKACLRKQRAEKPPLADANVRNDWQTPGPTGPKTKARAEAMRKPPLTGAPPAGPFRKV